MANDPISCPFGCGYKIDDGDDYQMMQLHVVTEHPEDGEDTFSTSAVTGSPSLKGEGLGDDEDNWMCCPVDGCGEVVLLTELGSHVEMHEEELDGGTGGEEDEEGSSRNGKRVKLDPSVEERGATFDTKLSYALRNLDDVDAKEGEHVSPNGKGNHSAKSSWREILNMPASIPGGSSGKSKKRLGKSELGPYWNEDQMPAWLVKLLKDSDGKMETVNQIGNDGKMRKVKLCPNMSVGVVPVVARLLEQDRSVAYAYICDPAVKHVSKLKREGGFCGYRNIQMISSYIIAAEYQGNEVFKGKIPTIFEIQDHIEDAWDNGINANGRVETGGIRGTRKYIGTPDAQAMFCNLGISCEAEAFKPNKEKTKQVAYDLLFNGIEKYFRNGCTDYDPKIRRTSVPPIYFQHPGHSMTIIGFEKSTDGSRNLLVFDPMFHDAQAIISFTAKDPEKIRHRRPEELLKAYRRGARYLRRYNEFEILRLTPTKKVSPDP